MASKIMFRGDSRHPINDTIFANGLTKRDASIPQPVYRGGGANMSGDLDPESGVCVSVRFQGAALFPLRFDNSDPQIMVTYIYVVLVDTDHLLNTHQQQVTDALGAKVNGRWQNPDSANNAAWSTDAPMWPLFAHEMAVNSVAAGNILSAVECTRTWTGNDWTFGGTYRLGTVYHNPNCTVTGAFLTSGRNFLANEVNNHRNSALPNGVGGFTLAALN